MEAPLHIPLPHLKPICNPLLLNLPLLHLKPYILGQLPMTSLLPYLLSLGPFSCYFERRKVREEDVAVIEARAEDAGEEDFGDGWGGVG